MNDSAVDISRLDEYNDVEEIDPESSVYDQAPPPPEGRYVFKLSAVANAVDAAKRVDGDRTQGSVGGFIIPARGDRPLQRHLYIVIDHRIVAEGKPWNGASKREWVNTMKDDQLQTTPVDTYLKLTTGQAGVGLSTGQKALKLFQKLAEEPMVEGEIRWVLEATEDTPVTDKQGNPKFKGDGSPKTERKRFKPSAAGWGMKNFPVRNDSNGEPMKYPDGTVMHLPLSEDPVSGAPARTTFEIVGLKPLSQGGN